MADACIGALCFVPLQGHEKLFGFSEFLAALALMVLAWTVGDFRYRFRVNTAPIPVLTLTFISIIAIGILTLLTDLWRSARWLVPRGPLISPAEWQAFLGLWFLATCFVWLWFAFVKPAKFTKWNAKRFASNAYGTILRGAPDQLAVLSDEIFRSAKNIVQLSWESAPLRTHSRKIKQEIVKKRKSEMAKGYAYDLLQILADRKFCRQVVSASPTTALSLFEEMAEQKKLDLPLDTFAKNITSEAISNRDSFAYQEVSGYQTGYVGHHKPLTKALYGNYRLVEKLDHVFDVDYRERADWNHDQWDAFCRLVLVSYTDYATKGNLWEHPTFLFRAIQHIQDSVRGLYRLNGSTTDWWTTNDVKRLGVVVRFTIELMKILDARFETMEASEVTAHQKSQRRKNTRAYDVFDAIAELAFALVLEVSSVRAPKDLAWSLQFNSVWCEIFHTFSEDGCASKIIKMKLRRLIYDSILELSHFPNYKASKVLSFALNVLGLKLHRSKDYNRVYALHRAVLSWVRKSYAKLAVESPRIAADCLPDGLVYERTSSCLVKTGDWILDRKPRAKILYIDPFP